MTSILPAFRGLGFVRLFSEWCLNYNVSTLYSYSKILISGRGGAHRLRRPGIWEILSGWGELARPECYIAKLLTLVRIHGGSRPIAKIRGLHKARRGKRCKNALPPAIFILMEFELKQANLSAAGLFRSMVIYGWPPTKWLM